jgi:hypothetical protein
MNFSILPNFQPNTYFLSAGPVHSISCHGAAPVYLPLQWQVVPDLRKALQDLPEVGDAMHAVELCMQVPHRYCILTTLF